MDHQCLTNQERKASLLALCVHLKSTYTSISGACACFWGDVLDETLICFVWILNFSSFPTKYTFKHKDAYRCTDIYGCTYTRMLLLQITFFSPSQIITQLIIIFQCTALVHPLSLSWNYVFNDPIKLPRLILIYLKDPALVTLFRSFEAWVNMTNGFQVFPLPSAHPESSSPTRWDGHADNLIKL